MLWSLILWQTETSSTRFALNQLGHRSARPIRMNYEICDLPMSSALNLTRIVIKAYLNKTTFRKQKLHIYKLYAYVGPVQSI